MALSPPQVDWICLPELMRRSLRDPRRTLRRLTREHEAILDAVAAGDGERAATLFDEHIRGFYRSVRRTSAA